MEFNATFLISAISFIVFVFIMNAIFYKPLEKIVNEREKFISDTLDATNSAKEKAGAIAADKEHKLNKSRSDAKKLMNEKTEKAKLHKDDLTNEAKLKSTQATEAAKEELNRSNLDAEKQIEEQIATLAEMISKKVLGEDVEVLNA